MTDETNPEESKEPDPEAAKEPEPEKPDAADPEGNRLVMRVLGWVERIGNKLPDPAFLFLGALVLVWIISAILSGITIS